MSERDRERWNDKWRARRADFTAASGPHPLQEPAAALVAWTAHLPRSGRALDLAGGSGRHALWLAGLGLAATVADISPEGLALARTEATRLGRTLATLELDLDDPAALPTGPWALVVIHHFLDRTVLGRVHEILAPGGLLAVVHPTVRNLERHPRPSARWLLDDGELPGLVDARFERLVCEESWGDQGRFEARLLARWPPSLS